MLVTDGYSKKWLRLTLLLTAVLVLLIQIPLLLDPLFVDEDLRFFYWLHRIGDRSLFQADPLLGYQFAELNLGFTTLLFNKVSLLYGTLYAVFSQFISPLTFSKLLMLPLALVSSYFLFRIGERLAGSFRAFLLCLVFTLVVTVPYSGNALSSGLPRAFSLPLLLAMLYYMLVENYLGMAVVLVMGLFYPPIYVTILLTYGVRFTLESVRRRRLALTGRQFAVLGTALLLTLLLLLPALLTGLNTVPAGPEESQGMTVFSSPLYGDKGRYPLLNATLSGNGGVFDFGLIGLYSMFMLLLLIPLLLILGRRFKTLPAPFWYLVLAGLVGFTISWLAILFTPSASFHMPSRYLQTTVFIVGLFLYALNAPLALQVVTRGLASARGRLGRPLVFAGMGGLVLVLISDAPVLLAILIGLLAACAIVLALLGRKESATVSHGQGEKLPIIQESEGPDAQDSPRRGPAILAFSLLLLPLLLAFVIPGRYERPPPDSAELVTFARTLPKDVLISGYPCSLDDVPLYAQRTVLFSCEVESRDMTMMLASLDAYFAESEEQVLEYCRQYGVDYMVASPWTFSEAYRSQERLIYDPFDTYLKQQLDGRSGFALERIPESAKIFQNDSHFVFPCSAEAVLFERKAFN